jgi:hypothetical protein
VDRRFRVVSAAAHSLESPARCRVGRCLEGFISTARAIGTAITFGTNFYQQPGWLHVTVVHGGFVVPFNKANVWGTDEAEIAQWRRSQQDASSDFAA